MDLSAVKKEILAALTYFSLFDYPLKKGEIFIFMNSCRDIPEFEEALDILVDECLIFRNGYFFSLDDNKSLVDRRQRGNAQARRLMPLAGRAARIISAFPFIKGVAVSGSLSKNYADEDADIDFFLITTSERLWIARTFLHIFKKLTFLVRKEHHFCMNYFIDEKHLVIAEKNIYTAVEVSTILPFRGTHIFERFFIENKWTKTFFPNNYLNYSSCTENKSNPVRLLIEWMLNNRVGDKLDNYLMNLTRKRWKSKTHKGKRNGKGLILSMDISKHFSKPDPDDFQKRLLKRYDKCLIENYQRFELSRFFL